MTPADLLKTLEAEGVSVSLNLKLEADTRPSDDTRALIREHRDALLEHLAGELYEVSNTTRVSDLPTSADKDIYRRVPETNGLTLYGDLLHSLMVWVSQHHELRMQHPNGLTLNANPDHVRDAVTQYPWGVLYTDERHVLLTWGAVPTSALLGKRDLKTDELLVKEARTAA